MKKIAILALALVLLLTLAVTPVMAKGPIGAGGKTGYIPFNPTAWERSGQFIGPSILGVGTPTTIWEDGVTISVSEIPEADFDWELFEYLGGTILMWKVSHAWMEDPYQRNAWASYKFWLNGSGTVTITRYNGTTQIVEQVTEFIFFKVQYVGNGEGNSDIDQGRNFDITIQAYK